MSCTKCLLVFCLFVSSLHAEKLVILDGSRAWYVPTGSSVAVQLAEYDRVIRMAGGPNGPTDPPAPPGDSTELTLLASTWRTKVVEYDQKNLHRLSLSAMYSTISGEITKDGSRFSSMTQLQTVTRGLISAILGSDKEKWIPPWSADIDSYLLANVSDLDEAAVAYSEIAAGLSGTERIGDRLFEIIRGLFDSIGDDGTLDPAALIKFILGLLGGI